MRNSLAIGLFVVVLALGVFSSKRPYPDFDRVGAESEEEGPRPDGPAEYVKWRNLSLRDETGQIAPNGLMAGKAQLDLMLAQSVPPVAAGIGRSTWSSLGPGNVGGRVRSIAIHPTEPETMFAGSVGGGIWKTTDGGGSWKPVDDFLANLAVSAIVMVHGTPNTIFVGTGEGFYNGDGLQGAGIFKSIDGGMTFTQLAATSTSPGAGQSASDYYYVNELAVSPAGTTILAATRTGIFRSIDGGGTFARTTMVGGGAIAVGLGIVDVDFDPVDSSRAVASTFAGTALYSTDGGATWTLATGMPNTSSFQRSELAYAPSNSTIVYASVDLDSGSLYKSTDSGQSYAEVFDGAVDAINPLGGQGWYDNLLWVSPTDSAFVVWGGIDLWRSTNSGVAFSQMSAWAQQSLTGPTSAHADHHIAVAHPGFNGTSNKTVYFGNDGGVYKATDVSTVGGGSFPYQSGWTELNNGLAITQFYGGAGNPGSGKITGGTQDNGTLLFNPSTPNPTENWTRPFGGDGGFSAYDSADSNYFYGEYVYLQLHRNTTGGAGPSAYIYSGIGDAGIPNNTEFIAAFVKDPNNNDRMLGASVRLYRTNNLKAGTPTWEVVKDTLGLSDKISAIGVAPGNSDIVYAGHNAGRLYKTTTATSAAATVVASWATIDDNSGSNPLPNRRITRITIDPNDNDIVYVTFGGFSGDNIYRSTNGGTTWNDITGAGGTALPNVPVRDLEINPSNSNWLYAGTEIGVFASEDGGANWFVPTDGPAGVSVDELFFLGTNLVAVTHGRGMFMTPTLGSGGPGAFSKTAPANGAVSQSTGPMLSWGASTGATSYEVCYDTSHNSTCNTSWMSVGASTSVTLNGLSPGTIYSWQVRAISGAGVTYADGSAGTFWKFTTIDLLPFVVGQGPYPGNGGWFQVRRGQPGAYGGGAWHQIPWPAYNVSGGEVHPAFGDVDGDGRDEVVIGLGPGGAGWIAILDDAENNYVLLQWIQVQWVAYNRNRGEVFPAVADLDGDGKAEIVAGLGPGGQGWMEIFDDTSAGYAHLTWRQTTWAAYNAGAGATHPAAGDVDGDGKAEIVVGLGSSGAGWLEVFDDASTGYTHKAWVQVVWPAYTKSYGTTWPAVGDVDGDGKAEIVVGLGVGGGGWVEVFDDAVASYAHSAWMQVNWVAYNQTVGEVHPAVGNLDDDPAAEVVLGLGSYPGNGGWFEIRDDSAQGFSSIAWRSLDWAGYKTSGGGTWPAIGKTPPGGS